MAKIDWNITGIGGQAVVEDVGSMRCRLSGQKLMLWNGNNALTDSEVVAEYKLSSNSTNTSGGLLLRSTSTGLNCYRLRTTSDRTHYIDKLVGGVVTVLGSVVSSQPWNQYIKTRFRIDGFQISIEEYFGGVWNLVSSAEDNEHTHASGYAGIFGSSVNTSYSMLFDNVEISQKS